MKSCGEAQLRSQSCKKSREVTVALAWTHAEKTCRQRHTKRATVDTPREAQTRTAEDHLAQLKLKRRSLAWRGVSLSRRPRTGGDGELWWTTYVPYGTTGIKSSKSTIIGATDAFHLQNEVNPQSPKIDFKVLQTLNETEHISSQRSRKPTGAGLRAMSTNAIM